MLDGDPDDPQRRRFGTRSYGDLTDAVVAIGKLVRARGRRGLRGSGLWTGAGLPPQRASGRHVRCGGLVLRDGGVRPGAFRQRDARPSPARTGREAASILGRRVQAYGGDRRVPHVRCASDVAIVAGSLTVADPGRFKEMTQIYAHIGLPRWEATRRAYTGVTARSYVRRET